MQLIQNSLPGVVTRTPRRHHITPVLKSLCWPKIPERIYFKVLSLINLQLPPVLPAHVLRELLTIQPSRSIPILPSYSYSAPGHFSSHVRSPTEPYPLLHYAFGLTYYLNSAPLLYFNHCQFQGRSPKKEVCGRHKKWVDARCLQDHKCT